jgi:molecular chaperone GrpE
MTTRKRIPIEHGDTPDDARLEAGRRGEGDGMGGARDSSDAAGFRVEDRRHWLRDESTDDAAEPEAGASTERRSPPDEGEPRRPSVLDEYRLRTEAAEQKLQEYIEAYKAQTREQEAFRRRTERDVERRVQLQFADLVRELLDAVDTLELALEHVAGIPQAEPLARGVALARDRFLSTLERHGVSRIDPTGSPFDPNEAEALRVDPVPTEAQHDLVTATLRPGYRLGDHVIRPARVAVGRRA